jgi:hypothetical protein
VAENAPLHRDGSVPAAGNLALPAASPPPLR